MSKKNLWFKRKTYGYGWYPITWQGWLSILIFIIAQVSSAIMLAKIFPNNEEKFSLYFIAFTLILVTILIFISYKKGEKPRWQWGEKRDKK